MAIDIAKTAVSVAAGADKVTYYAVANAKAIPVSSGCLDAAVIVFGPMFADEVARVLRHDGVVVAVHPGPNHLAELRRLVYSKPVPHVVKRPFRSAQEKFEAVGSRRLTFPVVLKSVEMLSDLFDMTPYRWHAPENIYQAIREIDEEQLSVTADVILSTYRLRK